MPLGWRPLAQSLRPLLQSHAPVLVKLFWSKLDRSTSTSTAAPVPRRSRRAFRRDFRRRGCGVVQIPEKRISGLRSVAAQYLRKELETPGSLPLPPTSLFETDLDDEDEDERKRKEGEGSFRRAGGLNVAFPQSMSWHWATDRNTLEAGIGVFFLSQNIYSDGLQPNRDGLHSESVLFFSKNLSNNWAAHCHQNLETHFDIGHISRSSVSDKSTNKVCEEDECCQRNY